VPLPNDIGLQTGDRIRLDNVEQGCAEGQAPVQIRRGLTSWESLSSCCEAPTYGSCLALPLLYRKLAFGLTGPAAL
jgi:hypothetical protein